MPYIGFKSLEIGINLPAIPQKSKGGQDSNNVRGTAVSDVPEVPGAVLFVNAERTESAANWAQSLQRLREDVFEPEMVQTAKKLFFANRYDVTEGEIMRHLFNVRVPALRFRGMIAARANDAGLEQMHLAGPIRKSGKLLISDTVATRVAWTSGLRFAAIDGLMVAWVSMSGPAIITVHTQSPFYAMPGIIEVPNPTDLKFPSAADVDQFSEQATCKLRHLLEGAEVIG